MQTQRADPRRYFMIGSATGTDGRRFGRGRGAAAGRLRLGLAVEPLDLLVGREVLPGHPVGVVEPGLGRLGVAAAGELGARRLRCDALVQGVDLLGVVGLDAQDQAPVLQAPTRGAAPWRALILPRLRAVSRLLREDAALSLPDVWRSGLY